MTLDEAFAALRRHRAADVGGLAPEDRAALVEAGVGVRAGTARVGDDIEFLSAESLRRAVAAETLQWISRLEVRPSIGSTNAELVARGVSESVDGAVLAAEVQTAGRGRRGRTWLSPFGRNLAVSAGMAVARPAVEIGALGLAIGLAVRDALGGIGVPGVELKWPNDVLVEGRKVAGILIELVRTSPVEVVIGIGINVGCGAAVASRVDQTVADVAETVPDVSRNALLAHLLDRVLARTRAFEAGGFAPMRAQWQRAHRYHGRTVTVVTPTERVTGVAGVADSGALLLAVDGVEREFTGGEVTVREGAPAEPPPA